MDFATAGYLSFLSLVIGAVATWLYFYRRYMTRGHSHAELEMKAQTAQSLAQDLRGQLDKKDQVIEQLREQLSENREARVVAETKLQASEKSAAQQKELLDQAQTKFAETFSALSGDALKSNNQAFLELAQSRLETLIKESSGDLGQRQEAIKGLVQPLQDTLKRYENQIAELENNRAREYGSLDGQIKALIGAQQQLQKETGNLVTALRRPEVKGRWGEIALRRIVELAGMSQYCDFTEQVSVETDEGRLRPDLIVHMPAGRDIIIDSKVSNEAYINAIEAQDDEVRQSELARHAQQVRKHVRELSSKSYWSQFPNTPEFVVMFLPEESFFSAALLNDRDLLEDAMKAKVIPATPTTLITLLLAVAYGWKQEQVAENAKIIAVLGKELLDRFKPFMEHVNRTGGSLDQAVNSFNRMVNSLNQRVLVSVKKFQDLGIAADQELADPEQIESIPINRTLDHELLIDQPTDNLASTDLSTGTPDDLQSEGS